MLRREYIILHHTGAEEKDTEHIRRNHLQRGFMDIGYNYVIEKDGLIVEGRALDIPGAHCVADRMNFRSIGVALIGNFEVRHPYPAQLQSLAALLKLLQVVYGIELENILLHKEVKGASTKCPGRYFFWEKLCFECRKMLLKNM